MYPGRRKGNNGLGKVKLDTQLLCSDCDLLSSYIEDITPTVPVSSDGTLRRKSKLSKVVRVETAS